MYKNNSKDHPGKRTKDCCKDKEVSLKIQGDYQATTLFIDRGNEFPCLVAAPLSQACQSYTYNTIPPYINNGGPPTRRRLPLFVYNSVFRI
jgi:hypothetical protein